MPQFHGMIAESDVELRRWEAVRANSTPVSFHPSQYIVLNSPDPRLVEKSIWDVASQAEMLDRMEMGPEAVIVIHVGGSYGDRPRARPLGGDLGEAAGTRAAQARAGA
jgi:UV DNA damage endonuclease